jgi:hypothetical protein
MGLWQGRQDDQYNETGELLDRHRQSFDPSPRAVVSLPSFRRLTRLSGVGLSDPFCVFLTSMFVRNISLIANVYTVVWRRQRKLVTRFVRQTFAETCSPCRITGDGLPLALAYVPTELDPGANIEFVIHAR